MPFSCSYSQFAWKSNAAKESFKVFDLFMSRMDRLRLSQFQGDHSNDIPIVEDLLLLNILLFDIESVEGNIFGGLARRSVQSYRNFVTLLR